MPTLDTTFCLVCICVCRSFRFYSDGVWKQDKSLKVIDVTSVLLPGEGVGAEDHKAGALKAPAAPVHVPPVNPQPHITRKVDKKLEAVAAAAAVVAAERAAGTVETAAATAAPAAAATPSLSRLGAGGAWRRSAGMLAATSATWFVGVPTFKVALKALSVHRGFRDHTATHVHDAYHRAAHFQFINVQGGFAEGPPESLAQ